MADSLSALLVGCGGISREWIRAVTGIESLELAGLVDIDPGRMGRLATEFDAFLDPS